MPPDKLKRPKKREKIKLDGEDYFIDNFKEDSNFDEKTGNSVKLKEITLTRPGKTMKKASQKYFVNYNKEKKSIQLAKTSEKSEKSENGFSYEKNVAIISYGGVDKDEFALNKDSQIAFDLDDDSDSEEDW